MYTFEKKKQKIVQTKLGIMNPAAKICAITAPLLLVSQIAAGPAHADEQAPTETAPSTTSIDVIETPTNANVTFERPALVSSVAAPVRDTAVAVQSDRQPEQSSTIANPVKATPQTTPQASTPAPAAPVQTPQPAAAPVNPAPVSNTVSDKGAAIAAAAIAQIGRIQDCTALATNAIAAVGINFHGWPAQYIGLGHVVSASEARPGDLIYYVNGGMGVAHIAVYIGNGQAVHGGWDGDRTVMASAFIGSGPVFIRL